MKTAKRGRMDEFPWALNSWEPMLSNEMTFIPVYEGRAPDSLFSLQRSQPGLVLTPACLWLPSENLKELYRLIIEDSYASISCPQLSQGTQLAFAVTRSMCSAANLLNTSARRGFLGIGRGVSNQVLTSVIPILWTRGSFPVRDEARHSKDLLPSVIDLKGSRGAGWQLCPKVIFLAICV